MKRTFAFLLVAASLLLASGVQAQTVHFRVNVPFDFIVGDRIYGAGTYDVNSVWSTASNAIIMNSQVKSLMFLTSASYLPQPAESSALVFHKVGDEYFLYQLRSAGTTREAELPEPKRETHLAQNGAKPEEVVVAANLVK